MLEEVISQSRIDNAEALSPSLCGNMCENLDRLQQSFKSSCSDDLNFELWIRNPFLADLNAVCDDDLVKDDLGVADNVRAKERFQLKEQSRIPVFLDLTQAYPRLVKEPWLLLFLLLQATSVSQDFRLFLLSKRNNEIGWTSRTTCVLPCRKPSHSFKFLLKKSNNLRIGVKS